MSTLARACGSVISAVRCTIVFTSRSAMRPGPNSQPPGAAAHATPSPASAGATPPPATRFGPRRPQRPPHPSCPAPLIPVDGPVLGPPRLQQISHRRQSPRACRVIHPRPGPNRLPTEASRVAVTSSSNMHAFASNDVDAPNHLVKPLPVYERVTVDNLLSLSQTVAELLTDLFGVATA